MLDHKRKDRTPQLTRVRGVGRQEQQMQIRLVFYITLLNDFNNFTLYTLNPKNQQHCLNTNTYSNVIFNIYVNMFNCSLELGE